ACPRRPRDASLGGRMTRLNVLLFFGLLAAPLAWTAQLVVGYGIGHAGCSVAGMRWGVDSEAGTALLLAGTLLIGIAGLAVAGRLARTASRDERGRVQFMAGGGVLVS